MIAGFVVVLAGLWLLALAGTSFILPERATQFLSGYASSARVHYLEQILRIIAGAGFVLHAAEMRYSQIFSIFGWILVITSTGLLLIPWQWHNRFAGWAVPFAVRHLKLYALGALILAAFIFYALI